MARKAKATARRAQAQADARAREQRRKARKQEVGIANSSFDGLTPEGKWVWVILLGLVFIVPLVMSNATAFGFSTPFSSDIYDTPKVTILRIGSVLALLAWLYDLLKNGGKLRTTPLYYVLGAFLLWSTISTIFSVSPAISFFGKYRRYEGLWSYFIYASLFFLAVQYVTNYVRVRAIAISLSASSVIVAFYGLLQAMGIEPIMIGSRGFEAGRSYSTYGNPDLLAGFLAFGTFINFGLVLSEKNPRMKSVYWMALLLNAIVTVTSFARSIWVAVFMTAIMITIVMVINRYKADKVDLSFMGLAALATGGLVVRSLSSQEAVTNFAQRVTSIFQFNTGSAQTRFQIWDAAWAATKERPLFGYGPDTFRLVFRRFAPVEYAQAAGYRSVADNVHNYILQMTAGIGIPGMLLYYGFMIWVAIASFPLLIHSKAKERGIFKEQSQLYLGFWAACFAYMVHLFFGLSLPGGTFLLFICVGVLVAPLAREKEVEPYALATPVAAALLVPALVIVFCSASIFAGDSAYIKAQIEKNRGNLFGSEALMERAIARNPFNDMYKTELLTTRGAIAVEAVKENLKNQGGIPFTDEEKIELIDQAVEAGEKAIAFVPWEYDNYALFASFYNQLGAHTGDRYFYEQAVELVEPQVALTPTGLSLRFVYAQGLVGLRRFDEAAEQLEICMAQDTNYEGPFTLYKRLQERESEPESKAETGT